MRNYTMISWISILLAGAYLAGCSAKPKTNQAQAPAAPEMAHQTSAPDTRVQDDDARKQRMSARAREVFQTIYFPYDQSNLDEQARQILANVRGFLMDYPEVSVSVEGHADERGTNEYNLALGDRRSNAVSNYLASLGVPKACLKTVSFGEERPAREGHAEADWKMNRRVDFAPAP